MTPTRRREILPFRALCLAVATGAAAASACSSDVAAPAPEGAAQASSAALCASKAVGLAIEIDNGVGKTLRVKKGQRFWLNQIDMRAAIDATTDEGVSGLARSGDFANLDWRGVTQADEEPVLLSNPDGTYTDRRFFRYAKWMNEPSTFVVQQRDAQGRPTSRPYVYRAGREQQRSPGDDFFDRRLRAIQWIKDCVGPHDCTGAASFQEEALVELRYAEHADRVFDIDRRTAKLTVEWSANPGRRYEIPVEQIEHPTYAYGFDIQVDALTPPRADGTYAPGTAIDFRVTLKDGAGNRLHPPGALPSYNEVRAGNDAGIVYYNAFFDPTTTYYRRKHRERMMMSQIIGPAQDVQAIRTIIDLDKFVDPAIDVQTTGTLAKDGVFSQFRTFPSANDLFGGAFDPTHAGWDKPVPDTWTYTLPADAPAGTYLVTTKARRVYLGEDIPFTRTIEIQVGTQQHTQATLGTGGCNACHSGPSAFKNVLHANDNRSACAGCHVPLGFELEGPIYVRTHFIHSRSNRFDADLSNCSNCHLSKDSIQRTSKSACLSCHKSYPDWHVQKFGPIESMYVGGGRESFDSCTTSCHTNHPGSHLN